MPEALGQQNESVTNPGGAAPSQQGELRETSQQDHPDPGYQGPGFLATQTKAQAQLPATKNRITPTLGDAA